MINLFLFGIIVAFVSYVHRYLQYKKSTYYRITGNSYLSVKNDKGRNLEFLTYKSLRDFEYNGGKLLFNLHIPKGLGKTTEIDVLLICSKGLFVFECKNYSGWIFGNEFQRSWTQTLPVGKGRCHKEHFYNPIMQNASHIKHLKSLIGKKILMWSIIVFSDRCIFKNVYLNSNDVSLIKHGKLRAELSKACRRIPNVYNQEEINYIYNKLYSYA